jgi:hypothetical protein
MVFGNIKIVVEFLKKINTNNKCLVLSVLGIYYFYYIDCNSPIFSLINKQSMVLQSKQS